MKGIACFISPSQNGIYFYCSENLPSNSSQLMAAGLKYPFLSSKNGDTIASMITLTLSESSWKIKNKGLLNPFGTLALKRGSGNYSGFMSRCLVYANGSILS